MSNIKYLKPASEIDKERFYEMLEVLPPESWRTDENGVNSFRMCEYTSGSITASLARYKGKYIEKMIDVSDKETFITIQDFINLGLC